MAPQQSEIPIDVSRQSVVRLLKRAFKYRDDCVKNSYAETWWEGYIRCCEQILEMENE